MLKCTRNTHGLTGCGGWRVWQGPTIERMYNGDCAASIVGKDGMEPFAHCLYGG